MYIARCSLVQLSELGQHGANQIAKPSIRQQEGSKPVLSITIPYNYATAPYTSSNRLAKR